MHIKKRIINGRKYRYAARSIRMPDGSVRSLQKIMDGRPGSEVEKALDEKEAMERARYLLKKCRPDHIFTEEEFAKIERIRVGYRKVIRKLDKASLKDMLDRFTANFTYESNALEGNSLTLKDVTIVMFENASPKGSDLREVYETRNSRKVVELIAGNKFRVSEHDIIRMYSMLMMDIDPSAGYKKIPNFIVGSRLKTALPENVPVEMKKLLGWYAQNEGSMHPLKLAALFHGKFEQIHPFRDGNGRVGRFLVNIILVSRKYPPLIVRKSQRIAYLRTLEKFDSGHTDAIERFMLERFKETYRKFFEVYVKYL